MFIGFRQRNLGSRPALARLSLAKKYLYRLYIGCLYRFDIGFCKFSTEELRLTTGASAPVARKIRSVHSLL